MARVKLNVAFQQRGNWYVERPLGAVVQLVTVCIKYGGGLPKLSIRD